MQQRFYELLKRYLQVEIEQRLPKFPWESEVLEYESEYQSHNSSVTTGTNTSVPVWALQLHDFNLSSLLPEPLFIVLVQRCQTVITTPCQLGAKLVRVVKEFFPEEVVTLHDLAGRLLIMESATRSGKVANHTHRWANRLAEYELAPRPQQMLMTLMAAHEIITALTITVSIQHPQVRRSWLTTGGVLDIKVNALTSRGKITTLRVAGDFPRGGTLEFGSGDTLGATSCLVAGSLSVERGNITPGEMIPLNVYLPDIDPTGLTLIVEAV